MVLRKPIAACKIDFELLKPQMKSGSVRSDGLTKIVSDSRTKYDTCSLLFYHIQKTQKIGMQNSARKKSKKGIRIWPQEAIFLHTPASTHNLPVYQVSGSRVKNFLTKWPKTFKNPTFYQLLAFGVK